MDLMQAIKERRSVRKFKPDPVGDELLRTILEAGRWAPSWANTQCWRFIVIRDSAIKASLAQTRGKGNPAGEAIRNAPITIAICGVLRESGFYKGEAPTEKGDWYMFDTALAAQNMMLTAYSLGLGTVAVGLFDAQKVSQILDMPENISVVLLMPLGYPDEEPKNPGRKELPQLLSYDKYSAT